MNGFYVTVSIPLILVLAGFNHAHGLTTFGKATNQQNTPQQPAAQPKHCTHQSNCTYIRGTTCLRGFCYCGDNTHPINGNCKAEFKAPRHLCLTDNECVDDANCGIPKDLKPKPGQQPSSDKVCVCQEGFTETQHICAGVSKLNAAMGFIFFLVLLLRKMD